MPLSVLIIIAANILLSFKGFNDKIFFYKYAFTISGIKNKEYTRYLSSGFLHVDITHLFFNLFALYTFADVVIYSFGEIHFCILYVLSLLAGNSFGYLFHKKDSSYIAVGASGAVMGVVFAAILLQPQMSLFLLFIPIPIPAYVFAIGYLLYTLYGMKKQNDAIGHAAHLGGAIGGIVYTIILFPNTILQSKEILFILLGLGVITYIAFRKK